LLSKEERLA
jgi:hypothetical protein